MARPAKDPLRRPRPPRPGRRVHDDDPVGRAGDDTEVVGDEDQRHAAARVASRRRSQDLGLDGDVERRRRLVRDQEQRVVRRRHRDHGALAHAAGELVRVAAQGPLSGVGDAAPGRALDGRGPGLRPGRRAGARAAASASCSPTVSGRVERGTCGSWNTMASRRRGACAPPSARPVSSVPSSRMERIASTAAAAAASSWPDARRRLARAGLTDDADCAAGGRSKEAPARPVRRRGDGQVADRGGFAASCPIRRAERGAEGLAEEVEPDARVSISDSAGPIATTGVT